MWIVANGSCFQVGSFHAQVHIRLTGDKKPVDHNLMMLKQFIYLPVFFQRNLLPHSFFKVNIKHIIVNGEMIMDLIIAIVVVLVILWLLGFLAHLGDIIWLLLVIALIVIVYRLFSGRKILK